MHVRYKITWCKVNMDLGKQYNNHKDTCYTNVYKNNLFKFPTEARFKVRFKAVHNVFGFHNMY